MTLKSCGAGAGAQMLMQIGNAVVGALVNMWIMAALVSSVDFQSIFVVARRAVGRASHMSPHKNGHRSPNCIPNAAYTAIQNQIIVLLSVWVKFIFSFAK